MLFTAVWFLHPVPNLLLFESFWRQEAYVSPQSIPAQDRLCPIEQAKQ